MDKETVTKLLQKHNGKYSAVAKELGLTRQRIHAYCKHNNILVVKSVVKLPIDK